MLVLVLSAFTSTVLPKSSLPMVNSTVFVFRIAPSTVAVSLKKYSPSARSSTLILPSSLVVRPVCRGCSASFWYRSKTAPSKGSLSSIVLVSSTLPRIFALLKFRPKPPLVTLAKSLPSKLAFLVISIVPSSSTLN